MRKIRFRGKVIRTINGHLRKKGEWAYGYLLIDEEDDKYYIADDIAWFDGIPVGSFVIGELHEVDGKTVGQYIGYKDKNQREIYEGDIVRDFGFSGKEEERIGIVVWDDDLSFIGFVIESIKGQWADEMGYWWEWEELEVIGNIHDNPELLQNVYTSIYGKPLHNFKSKEGGRKL